MIPRRLEDRGGGLARVNGQVRILEGLAQPNESDEFKLRYYNSLTTWIDIDRLLGLFNLRREDFIRPSRIAGGSGAFNGRACADIRDD